MSFRDFLSCECGAITLDWIIAIGAIACLGIAVLAIVTGGTTTLAHNLSTQPASVEAVPVDSSDCGGNSRGRDDGSQISAPRPRAGL